MRRGGLTALLVGSIVVPVVITAANASAESTQQPRPLCLGKRATIVGNARANALSGTRRNDVIVGLGGNDTIAGMGGNDLVCGGAGADKLEGGAGSDGLDGGAGADTCRTGERVLRCEETRPNAARGPLRPGPYVTDVFRPRFGFVVGSGWSVVFVEDRQLLLAQRTDPGALSVTFDSFARRQSVAETIARVSRIEGVQAGAPTAATIGNVSGQRVDLLVTAGDMVLVPGLSDRYELEPNDRVRVYAVDVAGSTVTILVEAPAAEFQTFAQVAEAVLESVRWG
jgi:Ca2+-binding RTX toxin-like protein